MKNKEFDEQVDRTIAEVSKMRNDRLKITPIEKEVGEIINKFLDDYEQFCIHYHDPSLNKNFIRVLEETISETTASILALFKADKTKSCPWEYDDNYDFWETGCGEEFCLDDGTPGDNKMRYCYHCGKSIKLKEVNDDTKRKDC